MKISTATTFLALFASSAAHAQAVLQTPFQLSLTSPVMDSLLATQSFLQNLNGSATIPVSDIQITNPFQVNISGINVDVNYSFLPPQHATSGIQNWQIESKNISAKIHVQKIDASQVIDKVVGGIIIHIRVDAVCTDVQLSLPPGAATASANLNAQLNDGHLQFELAQFNANWAPGSWQIDSMNCSAPDGFDQLVRTEAAQQLQTINPFLPQIEQSLRTQLAQLSQEPLQFQFNLGDVGVTIDPKQVTNGPNSTVLLSGQAGFTFSNLSSTDGCAAAVPWNTPQEPTVPAPSGSSSILVPFGTIQGLLRCFEQNGSLAFTTPSSNIPAFQSLLASGFSELFVWPDLLNFKKKDIFFFHVFAMSEPVFANPVQTAPDVIEGDLATSLAIGVLAPKNGSHIPYVNFFAGLSGHSSLTLQNGMIKIQLPKPSLSMKAQWDPLYVMMFKPNTSLNKSLISSSISDYLKQTGLQVAVPSLTLANGQITLKPTHWALESGNARVLLDVTTAGK